MNSSLNISHLLDLFDKKEKKNLILIFIMMFANSLLEIIGIGLIIPLVKVLTTVEISSSIFLSTFANFFKIADKNILLYLVGVFLIFQIFKILFNIFYLWVETNYIYTFKRRLSSQLLRIYLFQDFSFYSKKNSSTLMRNITYSVDNVTTFLFNFLKLSLDVLMMIFIFAFLLIYNYQLTLIIFLSLLLVSSIYLISLKNKLTIMGVKRQLYIQKKLQFFQESIENLKWIKISSMEDFFLKKFNTENLKSASMSSKSDFLKNLPRPFLELFMIIIISILLIYHSFASQNFDSGIFEILAVYLAAALRLLPSTSKILTSYQSLKNTSPDLEILSSEFKTSLIEKDTKISPIKFSREINLLIEDFAYPDESKFRLKDLNLNIKKNEKIGIVGESGAGKSTLIDLLLGILKLQKGNIKVDNISIKDDLASWHSIIGYVPQKITIIEDTIKNNVLFGKVSNDTINQKINFLLNKMNMTSFLNSKENGIDSIIGEKGSNISGGEMQRIAICRALIRSPKILILDEATSSLDMKNEANIVKYLSELEDTTIIFISHKMSSLKYCDKIYKLKDNKLESHENI